jgi:hypothetical protein
VPGKTVPSRCPTDAQRARILADEVEKPGASDLKTPILSIFILLTGLILLPLGMSACVTTLGSSEVPAPFVAAERTDAERWKMPLLDQGGTWSTAVPIRSGIQSSRGRPGSWPRRPWRP